MCLGHDNVKRNFPTMWTKLRRIAIVILILVQTLHMTDSENVNFCDFNFNEAKIMHHNWTVKVWIANYFHIKIWNFECFLQEFEFAMDSIYQCYAVNAFEFFWVCCNLHLNFKCSLVKFHLWVQFIE